MNCHQTVVSDVLREMEELPKPLKVSPDHLVDFTPPVYNVWKFKDRTSGNSHFGNTEPTILDNLLYLYTKPFDIVADPFAGGGSTINVCKKRMRCYWVSDRKVEPGLKEKVHRTHLTN